MRKLIFLSLLFLCGCVKSEFIGGVDFKESVWEEGQNAIFEFDTENMVAKNQAIDIFIRYRSPANGKKLKLFVKTEDADRHFFIDTLDVTLLGKNQGAIRSAHIAYRKNVQWSKSGEHKISLSIDKTVANIMSAAIEIR